MKNNDKQTRDQLRQQLMQNIRDNDNEAFAETFASMCDAIHDELLQEARTEISQSQQTLDAQIRAARGERMLTTEERTYFEALAKAMTAPNPKQALTDMPLVMPETVIDAVFENLRTDHPLLSKLTFLTAGAAIKMIYNTNGYQEAAWGELCDDIIKELTSGFKVANTNLLKLSAFLPVCKEALELGPEWLERYVREVLYEAFANGMEVGLVDGDGNDQPIGMTRQVGPTVSVTGGVYPRKTPITVKALDIQTLGNLLSLLAQGVNGQTRVVRDVIFVVNPVDYYKAIAPAITIKAPDGSYREELPFPMDIIQSPAIQLGTAVIGLAGRYFAALGSPKEGRIDYSDHAQFLQDNRVYIIKGFANGFPMDNNAFFLLDISDLEPNIFKVQQVTGRTPSADAALSALSLGSATLSPAFADDTKTYTASTTNATNAINATPADAGASITITLNGTEVPNGSSLTWAEGTNTVEIVVTAEDGTTTETYTVTVTKS